MHIYIILKGKDANNPTLFFIFFRFTAYSARDLDKPLPASERLLMKELISTWIEQVNTLNSKLNEENNIPINLKLTTISPTDTLSDTTEKEQTKVPMHVENWLHRVVDQISSDTDIRNEGNLQFLIRDITKQSDLSYFKKENIKVHTSMISWMVQLLVKGYNETPNEEWDQDFLQLQQEVPIIFLKSFS